RDHLIVARAQRCDRERAGCVGLGLVAAAAGERARRDLDTADRAPVGVDQGAGDRAAVVDRQALLHRGAGRDRDLAAVARTEPPLGARLPLVDARPQPDDLVAAVALALRRAVAVLVARAAFDRRRAHERALDRLARSGRDTPAQPSSGADFPHQAGGIAIRGD